ncbi:hypothetical protein MNBD_BACTEROID05-898 [hydrothermal vent metagenome]|uniref:Uncharacterized protein n=1 Tax=hydrothermal vent metagenome TaxID=652676 RepID=A0A3B0T976_9ZZZZ
MCGSGVGSVSILVKVCKVTPANLNNLFYDIPSFFRYIFIFLVIIGKSFDIVTKFYHALIAITIHVYSYLVYVILPV